MALLPFENLPDSAKLWIFAAERPLSDQDQPRFLQSLDLFLNEWQAHGKALGAGRELRYGQFLMIAADENIEAPSGCSIDTLTRSVAEIGKKFGVNFLSSALIYYRDNEGIRTLERKAFKEQIENGNVTSDSIVFNHSLSSLRELRQGKWETRASDSWHAVAFRFPVSA